MTVVPVLEALLSSQTVMLCVQTYKHMLIDMTVTEKMRQAVVVAKEKPTVSEPIEKLEKAGRQHSLRQTLTMTWLCGATVCLRRGRRGKEVGENASSVSW